MMKAIGELRIIKDHIYFRIIRRTRPLTIHTECMHKDNVWGAVQRVVYYGGNAMWFVVTPVNFDFVRTETGCGLKAQQWERIVLERYKWLAEHGQQIETHVHLRIKMSMYDSDEAMKRDVNAKILGAVSWLKNNGFNPSMIVFGWWSCNGFAIAAAKKAGLKTVERLDNYFIHDYDMA